MAAENISLRDLSNELADKLEISQAKAYEACQELFEKIGKTAHAGGRVSIFGFGSFAIRERKARTGRNPQTGESIKIAASKSLGFKAGSAQKKSTKKK